MTVSEARAKKFSPKKQFTVIKQAAINGQQEESKSIEKTPPSQPLKVVKAKINAAGNIITSSPS